MSGSTKPAYIEPKKKPFFTRLKSELMYQFMVWTAIVFVFIFHYIPLSGIVIAFKNYKFRMGIWGSEWVGLANFVRIFKDFNMGNALTNTLALSLFSTVVGFPATIIFTLILNECVNIHFKKTVQTVSYLPHFISYAVMAIILDSMLNTNDGVINQLLKAIGLIKEPIFFLGRADLYWPVVVISGIWKGLGWSAIVYLAVINGIDETLYEAAKIDGATRLQRIRYITLPALSGIIAIMLILHMGGILGVGFNEAYFLGNELNYSRANVLSYYVYQQGLVRGDFSFSTAIGMLQGAVSAFLMLGSNAISKKLGGKGLF